jgi:5'-nucleotidase (lipoprotein e(P4) family)
MHNTLHLKLALLVGLFAGCVESATEEPLASLDDETDLPGKFDGNTSTRRKMDDAIHWVRNSAEYRVAVTQAYRLAEARIDAIVRERRLVEGTWAVSMDADETIISNSQFEYERYGKSFSETAWSAWVARKEATVLPGVIRSIQKVHDLGGIVVVVTNRTTAQCEDSRMNFTAEGIDFDLVLCKTRSSEKEYRWRTIEDGTTAANLPPLEIAMWVGDNIQDFPDLTQSLRFENESELSDFGDRFIVIPNPMYGSWERNAQE